MRAVIADDHTLVRRGLRNLLEAHGITVVGEAQDGQEAIALARSQQPDVVLMDLRMPANEWPAGDAADQRGTARDQGDRADRVRG